MMVCISWVISLTLASPQALMFRKLKHPSLDFHQCTTNMVIETYSEVVFENQQAKMKFYGIDPSILYKLYSGSFLFFVYFFPLFCLIISYTIIIILIKRFTLYAQLIIELVLYHIEGASKALMKTDILTDF